MPRPQYLIPGLAVVMALLSRVDPRPSGGHASQLQLEAIKQSLLERLGLERPPVVRQPLDQDGLQRAHQVYREMLAQFRANRTTAELGTTVHLLRPKSGFSVWAVPAEENIPAGSDQQSIKSSILYPSVANQVTPESPQAGPEPSLVVALPLELASRVKRVAEGPRGRLEAPGHFYTLELPRTASLHQNLLVLRAELQLFKEALNWPNISRSNSTWATRVNIYKLVDGESLAPKLLASYVLARTSLTLDLRDPVDHWMAGPEQRLLLGLEFSADVSPLLATTTTAEGTEALPLEVATQERVRVRKARQLDEECGKGDGKCCLRSLKVSFEDIGWSDWVVAPSSYSMKFCEGSCPQNYKPASIHAQIKYRLHSLSGETPAPCCVPAAYEPMVVMHFGTEGKLVTQLFQDMIVTRCHCA